MITLVKYGALSGSEKYNVNVMSIDGLSTDTKPTNKIDGMAIPNGSIYTEIDTGTTYMYDSANVAWYEVSIGGGRPEGGIVLVGETTTPLTDEATTNPITVDGQSYTAQPNDAVIYGNKEFLFDGTKWHEFGDLSGLNADMIDDANTTNKFVTTSEKTTWNDKQNALNQTQMNAVNSGITTEDVSQINTNKNNISLNTAEITGQQNATTDTVAGRGYAIINGQRLYMGAAQMPERIGDIWLDGATVRESEYLLSANPLCSISTYKDTLNLATGACTRNIKKIVLTGQEDITSGHLPESLFNVPVNDELKLNAVTIVCSHYIAQANVAEWGYVQDKKTAFHTGESIEILYIRDSSYTTVADFKTYLQQQYANGTPVTVWYILETPTTETITVPSGNVGTVEGYLIQDGTPTPTNPIYPTANQVPVWG